MTKLVLRLDDSSRVPIYQQIVDQVKGMVARGLLLSGERLPAVRELARSLGVNPGTVARAYLDLEQSGAVSARRGGGTIVSSDGEDAAISDFRASKLTSIVNRGIIDALSQGFKPEEIEAAFALYLSRWRQERGRPGVKAAAPALPEDSLVLAGSHDLALEALVMRLRHRRPPVVVSVASVGSLAGLISLEQGKCHLAGIHLLDEETGEYNYPYISRILPEREVAVIHLAGRVQGLMVRKGNPLGIKGIEDLRRQDLTIANRQRGAGTRLLLDFHLRRLGIDKGLVRGYGDEMETHLQVASAVAGGAADTGLGIQAAARAFDLDFLPLFNERYDLAALREHFDGELMAPLRKEIQSGDFKKVVARMGGYDVTETGTVTYVQSWRRSSLEVIH